jgi:hypothetical protein
VARNSVGYQHEARARGAVCGRCNSAEGGGFGVSGPGCLVLIFLDASAVALIAPTLVDPWRCARPRLPIA